MEMWERTRESQVWKSIFRPGSIYRAGYRDTSRDRALAMMNNVLYHLHPVKVKRHGLKLTYTFCLGGLSFFLFILLTITGIYLMFFYRPTAGLGQELAYNDMQSLSTTVFFGQLMRNMHRWAAQLMVFTVFLHMARVFYHSAYKPAAVVHRLPAALGPAGDLGGVGGDLDDGLHAGDREPGPLRAAGVGRDRAGHADPLVRAACARAAVCGHPVPGGPLLAHPQGRRHLRAAVALQALRAVWSWSRAVGSAARNSNTQGQPEP